MLKIIEGGAYGAGDNDENDYRKMSNCIWNVIVTMTTVGYGDYYPITTLGRLICVFAAVGGTCLTSFMVITLQNTIQFTDDEDKAFNYREKIVMRDQVEKKAAIFFKCSFQFLVAKKKHKKAIEIGLPRNQVKSLKKKMKNIFKNKIKSKKKFKSLAKLYRNIYEVLSEANILKSKLSDFHENLSDIQENCEEMENYINNTNAALDEIEILQKNESDSFISALS